MKKMWHIIQRLLHKLSMLASFICFVYRMRDKLTCFCKLYMLCMFHALQTLYSFICLILFQLYMLALSHALHVSYASVFVRFWHGVRSFILGWYKWVFLTEIFTFKKRSTLRMCEEETTRIWSKYIIWNILWVHL
jgi:hypothetical protein